MRNWQLTVSDPLSLCLAADVRQFQTDYADDQIWELELGSGQSPALALTTRYGGRCGLARLVPMWVIDGRVVYEADAYARQPVLHDLYPNYLRLTAFAAPHLALQIEYWVMESHAVGGRVTLRNDGDRPTEAGLDLFAQFMREEEAGEINLLELSGGQVGLHLQNVGGLQPVILLENAGPISGSSPKLASRVSLPAGGQAVLRWVHAGRSSLDESLALAHHWLTAVDWEPYLKELPEINAQTPTIQTGDRERDAAIALSYRLALGSLVGPTGRLPYPSFVTARIPGRGFSPAGDGSDYYAEWSGQSALDAYLLLPVLAQAAPALAKGILRNFVSVAGADGFIDWKPGLGGQRAGMLSLPLLATAAWRVYELTEDSAFIGEVFPVLGRFFERWFAADLDQDQDGLPEWRSAQQAGLGGHPAFAPLRRWAENIDIRLAETPDLAAYLIHEGESLLAMAGLLGKKRAIPVLTGRVERLRAALGQMWDTAGGRFLARDRDTHQTPPGGLVAEGPGDEALIPSLELNPPGRLVVRALGGRDHIPDCEVTLEGLDAGGQPYAETLAREAFAWHRGVGAATSGGVYSRIDRVIARGLSRVYTLRVSRPDWTRQDASGLLPLWAGGLDETRTAQAIQTLTDPTRYWRSQGVPRCDAQDAAYDPEGANGCGGVYPLWNALLAEGLIEAGRPALAADLLERLLKTQVALLRAEKAFHEAYDSESSAGLGERNHLGGIVLLDVLWRLIGARVISERRVWIGGDYALPWPVTITHRGVTVERDSRGARIVFPSGVEKRVRSTKWRAVEDEAADGKPVKQPASKPFVARKAPAPEPPRTGTVRVNVVAEDDRSDPFA